MHTQHTNGTGDELGLPDGLSQRFRSPRPAAAAAAGDGAGAPPPSNPPPPPVVMDKEEFEAAASGGRFLEWGAELFKHPLAAHRVGHTPEDIRAVIKEGAGAVGF